MFTPDDILVLSKAGFTAQQIAGLSMLAGKDAPATEEPAFVAPAPVAPAPVAPAPVAPAPVAPAPVAPAPAPQPVDPVLEELKKLTGLVQSNNIMGTAMPKPQTPEEILAEIINPPMRKD